MEGYLSALRLMLADIFWSARTWCSGGYERPYLNLFFCLLLFIGVVRSIQLLGNKVFVDRHDNEANEGASGVGETFTPHLTDQERWLLVCFLTFCAAIIIVASNVVVPGARRVFSAVLFLIPIIALAPNLRWRSLWVSRLLNLVFLVGLVATAISSLHVIKTLWPPPPPAYRAWFVKGEAIAIEVAKLEQPANVVIDHDLEPAVDRLFCRLYMDATTRRKSLTFYSVESSKPGEMSLLKNGASAGPETPALDPAFVLVTKTQERADQLLPGLLARTSAETALKKVILIPGP
jgi:hypothetical protein